MIDNRIITSVAKDDPACHSQEYYDNFRPMLEEAQTLALQQEIEQAYA